MRATARASRATDVALGVIARTENRVSVRWKDIAPTMRSAHRRDRGPALLGARRARLARHRARGAQQRARRRHHARAARRSRSSSRRTSTCSARPAAARSAARSTRPGSPCSCRTSTRRPRSSRPTSTRSSTARAPTASRPRRTRSSTRPAKQLDAAAVGPARRPAAGAERLQPVPPPGRGAQAPRRGAAAPCASCAGSARPPTPRRSNAPLGLKRGSYGTPSPRRSCSTRCARSSNARLPAKLAARGGLRVYSTVDQRLQFAARRAIKDVLKTPGDPAGGARRDQRRTTATCSRSAPPTTARRRTSSTSRPPATARRARRSSSSRSWTRCAAGADPDTRLLPVRVRLVPGERPGLPAGGRLVARQRRARRAAAT